jgi:hypothetical protein
MRSIRFYECQGTREEIILHNVAEGLSETKYMMTYVALPRDYRSTICLDPTEALTLYQFCYGSIPFIKFCMPLVESKLKAFLKNEI